MPTRRIAVDGREWQVYPSGFLTQYVSDEFGLILLPAPEKGVKCE